MQNSLNQHEPTTAERLRRAALPVAGHEQALNALAALAATVSETTDAYILLQGAHSLNCVSHVGGLGYEDDVQASLAASTMGVPQRVVFATGESTPECHGTDRIKLAKARYGFYAGVALLTNTGLWAGLLVVVANGPKTLSDTQMQMLVNLARHVVLLLEGTQLRQEVADHTRLLEQTHDAVIRWGMNDGIVEWNRGAEQLYGWTRDEALDANGSQLLQTEFVAGRREFEHALRQRGQWEGRIKRRTKDGRVILVDSRCLQIGSTDSQSGQIMETNRDVTAQSRAEKLLLESEEQHRLLLDSMNDGVFVAQGSQFVFANSALARTLGYAWVELIGLAQDEIFPPEELAACYATFHRHLVDAELPGTRLQVQARTRHGTLLWVDIHLRGVRFKGQPGVLGIVRDVSEHKRIEKELHSFNELLTERVAEKTAEAKNLVLKLRAMAADLALAEERERRQLANDLHDDLAQRCAVVALKINHAMAILDGRLPELQAVLMQSLDLTQQIDRGVRSLMFQLSPPSLYQLGLAPALEWLAEEMNRCFGYSATVEGDLGACPLDSTSRFIVFRAVRELMINAGKHARTERMTVRHVIEAHAVRVEVEDFGRGFDVSSVNRPTNLAGFGLFNINERLQQFGGALDIRSQPNKGTLAVVTIAIRPPELVGPIAYTPANYPANSRPP